MGVKLVSSSAGSVELVAPVTASNYTATMPIKTGTVAMDGPAFSAYQNSSQSISATTFTKVTFDTEEFDTTGNFASSRFTPTVAGYYQINAALSQGAPTQTICTLYKNGTIYKSGVNGTNFNTNVSSLVYLNGSTDYVEVYAYIATSQSLNTGINLTYFNGTMVRGA